MRVCVCVCVSVFVSATVLTRREIICELFYLYAFGNLVQKSDKNDENTQMIDFQLLFSLAISSTRHAFTWHCRPQKNCETNFRSRFVINYSFYSLLLKNNIISQIFQNMTRFAINCYGVS